MKYRNHEIEITPAFTGYAATILLDGSTVASLVPGGIDKTRNLSEQHGYDTEQAAIAAAKTVIGRSENGQTTFS